MSFVLHPRLEADTVFVKAGPLSDFRLMDDARYCWLVLVPRVAENMELADLDLTDRGILTEEIVCTDKAIRRIESVDRVNIGLLGNLVPQLHAHVVGRRAGDAAWPGPVWGAGEPEPYPDDIRAERIRALQDALP